MGKALKFFVRLMRHPGTPESVGRGVSIGFFTALLLPFGHMAAAFVLSVPLRAARATAMLSTWIINPFTIPVVWPLSHERIRQMLEDVIHTPSIRSMATLSKELIASFFAGGALLGAVLAVAGYFCTVALVRRHRARLATRKAGRIRLWKTKGMQE